MAGGFNIGGYRLGKTLFPYPGAAAGFDPAVTAFATESGATDLTGLNDLVVYLKEQSLYDNFVIYPMKSAQNAGSGATVYSLGGLTTNDITLVNSPTWGSTGITFNGTTQYGSIADFLPGGNLTIFDRFTIDTPQDNDDCIVRQGEGTDRSFSALTNLSGTGSINVMRSSDGTLANLEQYVGDDTLFDNTDVTMVCEWIEGGGRNLYSNKTAVSLSLVAGSAQTSMFNSSSPISLMVRGIGGTLTGFLSGLQTAPAFCTAALTTTQRETITDLINAL